MASPNGVAFYDPTGAFTINDPKLVAAPLDPFGRPQLWDYRDNAGTGPVFRSGAWQTDGDPTNQTSEGAVYYGANAGGVGPISGDGGYARIKPNRFGLAQIIGGGALTYYFRVDPAHLYLADDAGTVTAEIVRPTGAATFRSVRTGGPGGAQWSSGAGIPNGAVVGSPGDLYSNTNGGAGTTLWAKESGVATNTGWVAMGAGGGSGGTSGARDAVNRAISSQVGEGPLADALRALCRS
jgi:hypothetical protein